MTASETVTAALARNVASYRKAAGLSQAQLAAKAGTAQATLASIECRSRPATLKVLFAVADALGVSPSRLVTGPRCPRCHDCPPAGFLCLTCQKGSAS